MKRTFFIMISIILALTLPAAGNSEKFEFPNGISWNTPLWLVQARERTSGHEPVNVYDNMYTFEDELYGHPAQKTYVFVGEKLTAVLFSFTNSEKDAMDHVMNELQNAYGEPEYDDFEHMAKVLQYSGEIYINGLLDSPKHAWKLEDHQTLILSVEGDLPGVVFMDESVVPEDENEENSFENNGNIKNPNEKTNEIYVTDIAAGAFHTVLLLSDGTARAYGDNSNGQCDIRDWTGVIDIKAFWKSTLGLMNDGTVLITPNSDYGEWVDSLADIQVIDAYGSSIIALDSAGTVHGIGRYGEKLDGLTNVKEISIGHAYASALLHNGTPVIIGNGNGGLVNLVGSERFPSDVWSDLRSISNGGYILSAEKNDGKVISEPLSLSELFPQGIENIQLSSINITDSGAGYLDEDGTAYYFGKNLDDPTIICRKSAAFSIGNRDFFVVLHTDGTVSAFGENRHGECDIDPDFQYRQKVVDIAVGWKHTVLLLEDGTVRAFGDPDNKRLNVQPWTDIIQIAAGSSHTVGLKSDGTVVCTGSNSSHQCEVSEWKNIKTIAAGSSMTLGLDETGMVYSTDSNMMGFFFLPIPDHIAIAAGVEHAVAVFSDGSVYGTGRNERGCLDTENWTDIVQVAASEYNTFGIKKDGTVAAAGYNAYGQADVEDLADIIQVSAATYHSLFLKSDGTVIAKGGLKDNDPAMNVQGWTDIVKIAAGDFHTVGLRSDGTVVAAGLDDFGQCTVPGEFVPQIEEQTEPSASEESLVYDEGELSLWGKDLSAEVIWPPVEAFSDNNFISQVAGISSDGKNLLINGVNICPYFWNIETEKKLYLTAGNQMTEEILEKLCGELLSELTGDIQEKLLEKYQETSGSRYLAALMDENLGMAMKTYVSGTDDRYVLMKNDNLHLYALIDSRSGAFYLPEHGIPSLPVINGECLVQNGNLVERWNVETGMMEPVTSGFFSGTVSAAGLLPDSSAVLILSDSLKRDSNGIKNGVENTLYIKTTDRKMEKYSLGKLKFASGPNYFLSSDDGKIIVAWNPFYIREQNPFIIDREAGTVSLLTGNSTQLQSIPLSDCLNDQGSVSFMRPDMSDNCLNPLGKMKDGSLLFVNMTEMELFIIEPNSMDTYLLLDSEQMVGLGKYRLNFITSGPVINGNGYDRFTIHNTDRYLQLIIQN